MANTVNEQLQTMIDNMPEKTGKSLDEWLAILDKSGLSKHGDIMKLLKGEHGVTHGFANTITQLYRQRKEGAPTSDKGLVEAQYEGAKADLKPIYDALIAAANKLGKDVEVAPKKTYVSLRRNKQFAIVQPSTKTRVDLGLNLSDVDTSDRLEAAGSWNSMCSHRIRLTSADEVDAQVSQWLAQAYEQN